MQNPTIRNAVWDALLEAEQHFRYYGDLAERHRRRHRALRYFLLFAAIGGISSLLDFLPAQFSWISEVSAVLIVALVIWDFMAEDGRKADVLHAISIECGQYELRLRHLIYSIDAGIADDPETIAQELKDIESAINQITARAGYADIPEHKRLTDKAWKESVKVVPGRFATSEGHVSD